MKSYKKAFGIDVDIQKEQNVRRMVGRKIILLNCTCIGKTTCQMNNMMPYPGVLSDLPPWKALNEAFMRRHLGQVAQKLAAAHYPLIGICSADEGQGTLQEARDEMLKHVCNILINVNSTDRENHGERNAIIPAQDSARHYKIKFDTIKCGSFYSVVPSSFTTIHKKELTKLKGKCDLMATVRSRLKKKRYIRNPGADMLYAMALCDCGRLTSYSAESVLSLASAACLLNLGIGDNTSSDVMSLSPGRTTIQGNLRDSAIRCAMKNQEDFKTARAHYLSCDKGNKGGMVHFVKMTSRWCFKDHCVKTSLLDISGAFCSSSAAAAAVAHTCTHLHDGKLFFDGICTDAGGGGTGNSFRNELSKQGLVDLVKCIITFCAIHNFCTLLRNAYSRCFGEGSLGKRNTGQLLHSLYDLHEAFPTREAFIMLKDYAASKLGRWNNGWNSRLIQKFVLTRWWRMNSAVEMAFKEYPIYIFTVILVLKNSAPSSKIGKISNNLISMLREVALLAEVVFCHTFCRLVVNKYLKMLQSRCPVGGTHGHLARFMPVMAFLIRHNVQKCKDCWKDDPEWEDYRTIGGMVGIVKVKDDNNNVCEVDFDYERRATLFFDVFLEFWNKEDNLSKWPRDLLFVVVAEEQPIATVFCRWCLGMEIDANAGKHHGRIYLFDVFYHCDCKHFAYFFPIVLLHSHTSGPNIPPLQYQSW